MRYKIVNVVAFAILNAFTLRKEEDEDKDKEHPPPTARRRRFVGGGGVLLKRGVDKDATEFETIINILLEERMHNELFESDEKREEEVSKKPVFYVRVKKA